MDEQMFKEKIEQSFKDAIPGIIILGKALRDAAEQFRNLPKVKSHVTTSKQGKTRIWWLSYGVDILCPNCKFCIIPIEEAWCGCTPIPRKLKKWCKGRRAVYKETS